MRIDWIFEHIRSEVRRLELLRSELRLMIGELNQTLDEYNHAQDESTLYLRSFRHTSLAVRARLRSVSGSGQTSGGACSPCITS